jgi:formylglycine-generating enzyme required for sulfatase activity
MLTKLFKRFSNWRMGWIILGICALVLFIFFTAPTALAFLYNVQTQIKLEIAYIDSLDLGKTPLKTSPKQQIAPKDGMVLIYIPAGKFLMGTDIKDVAQSKPQHIVNLSAFWIDRTEVSNAMYARCVKDRKCAPPVNPRDKNPYYNNPRFANYPVVYIRWDNARDYCKWAGRRLPTEAEWEKAARGTDGRTYPWGEDDPNPSLLNYDNNIGGPLPVNSYPLGASPYGVLNMAGNVREWVNDWYNWSYYFRTVLINPRGPIRGESRSLRGGAFDDSVRQITVYNRFNHFPYSAGNDRGFRCAMDGD